MLRTLALALALLVSLSACSRSVRYGVQEGDICVTTSTAPAGPQGQPQWRLNASVQYESCASSCTTVQSTCEVSVAGQALTFAPSAIATTKTSGDCPAACVPVQTQCKVPTPLRAGTYTIIAGKRRFDVIVPGDNALSCHEAGIPANTGGTTETGATRTTASKGIDASSTAPPLASSRLP